MTVLEGLKPEKVFYFFEKDYNIMITLSAINVNIGNVI